MVSYEEILPVAYQVAQLSRDPSTQNGAVLIDDYGTILSAEPNNFPDGVAETAERWERPAKYFFIEHAERNSIFAAARSGLNTNGLTMVCPWAACADCARAIVQAGIKTLVRHSKANDPSTTHARWDDTIVAGDALMIEGGVNIVEIDPIAGWKLRRNGELRDSADL